MLFVPIYGTTRQNCILNYTFKQNFQRKSPNVFQLNVLVQCPHFANAYRISMERCITLVRSISTCISLPKRYMTSGHFKQSCVPTFDRNFEKKRRKVWAIFREFRLFLSDELKAVPLIATINLQASCEYFHSITMLESLFLTHHWELLQPFAASLTFIYKL